MYEKLKEFKTRLESSRGSGAYWAMSPELLPAINNSPFCPLFHIKADKIYVVSTLFWKQLSNREGYITFPELEEFKVPNPVVRALGIDTENYLILFIGWCSLDPRIEQKDKTHRLSKAVFISREGLRFPIRERHSLFDSLISKVKDWARVGTQGHLEVFMSDVDIDIDIQSEYIQKLKNDLFFNHILEGDFYLSIRKDNQLLIKVHKQLNIFSWDHPQEEITLGEGVYLLRHPFPLGRRGID